MSAAASALPLPRQRSLTVPFSLSVLLHAGAIAAVLVTTATTHRAMPPVYRVQLVAAPAGLPAIGVVNPPKATPAPATPAPRPRQPAPTKAARKAVPTPKLSKSTATTTPPTVAAKAVEQPKAGSVEGGKGADVANLKLDSNLEFPYPAYLQNIVNQIRFRFTPPAGSALRTEVAFLLHRDGHVSGISITSRSGSYTFDLNARGAIDAAAKVNAFGALPDGFTDDVLPVVFSFDPIFGRKK